ncbi:hypothetical protein [Thermoflexus sp.]|uniref:hypothetical protein n=1 Tax=Thermoflexus sp. TaxID=1969742 RepID=UPI002ADE0C5D|nr:hypothetical protein [Thermoflexus sp.]
MDKRRLKWKQPLLIGLLWLAFLKTAWPASDLFRSVPPGPDTLEVLWALRWYREALGNGQSPFFYPLAFAPLGWHTANLAHPPPLIGLMLPWAVIGGEAFAFNVFGWIAMTLAFGGMYRLSLRRSRDPWIAVAAGMAYAFLNTAYSGLREFGGHLHVMGGLALLPWLILDLERARAQGWRGPSRWRAGVWWGMAALMHLQMLPIASIPVLVLGIDRKRWRESVRALALIAFVALTIAGPWALLFRWSFTEDHMQPHAIDLLAGTGYDWGFAFQWNPYSPFRAWMGPAAGLPQSPPIGLLPWVTGGLALAGWGLFRRDGPLASSRLLAIAAIGAALSAGVALKWRGPIVVGWSTTLEAVYQTMWRWAYTLNPSFMMESPQVPPAFRDRLYSPLLLLGLLFPILPYAAAIGRFASLFVLGGIAAASEAITRLVRHRLTRAGVSLAWILEVFSVASPGWPWPLPSHPVYEWLRGRAEQGMVLELDLIPNLSIRHSAFALLQTLDHRKPAVNGWGSFYPRWFIQLRAWVFDSPSRVRHLEGLGVQFLILHGVQSRPDLLTMFSDLPLHCFDSPRIPGLWDERICAIELSGLPTSSFTNLFLISGWSGVEPWGVWAESTAAEAAWLVRKPAAFRLEVQAFPMCPADRPQRITIFVNGLRMAERVFPGCKESQWTLVIPADRVQRGWNMLDLRFAYARSPAEATGGANPDPRSLSVGFRRLWIYEERKQ